MAHRTLNELPTKKGFRLRGTEMTRIETFTDAAFAFALTLLVVSLDVPTSYDELILALRGVPAFAISAVLLMLFWSGHHTWSRRYGLEDATAIVLSCVLVFTVLVYVYPLRFLSAAITAWMSDILGLPIPARPISLTASTLRQLFIIYGVGFAAMCAAVVLLNGHAWRRRDSLQLNDLERFDTKAEMGAWTTVGSVGVLSIIVALIAPVNWPGTPGWVYMLLPIVMPIFSVVAARRRKPLAGS